MRVKRGNVNRNKHKKVLKLTKGYKGSRSKIFVAAMQAMMHGLKRSYKHRRQKKRDMRALWIQRINAAAREYGVSYSRLMDTLNKAGVEVNRKLLAELAVTDKAAFASFVGLATK